ncbi:hypothetical protein N0V93_003573 [Gnomoniopsis smithogilvyi]|uniref:Uncharacterized protein n=1 Tax=Gnomoniopsis smithogilvyi TaxID=1191159 RepID=A0A9W8YYQ7_9PEZI|nr:hypothetical protein N0V93_003573 [Gnomoniopsis smithogilvyi]
MANGLDKLERLFSTKKKAAPSRHTAESSINGSASGALGSNEHTLAQLEQPVDPPCFPQSPFIRPKANMMQPRNELKISSPASIARTNSSRTNSTRSHRFSQTISVGTRSDEMNELRRQSTNSATNSFHIPNRTSSLLSRRHDRIPGGLIQLHLPRETAFASDSTQSSLFPDASSFPLKEADSLDGSKKGLLDALPIYPASRVETPPPSDQDDFTFPSPPERGRKPSAKLPQLQLTPEPSPDIIPQRDSTLSEPKSSTEINSEALSTAPSRRGTTSSVPLLDDDWRDSYIQVPENIVSSKSKTVFEEPALEDFLSMTDEDLAEIKVVHPSKPPSKRAPPPPVLSPTFRSGSGSCSFASPLRSPTPVSPAIASSQVAAWEAARIAKKYDFDVVYVASFGPSRASHLHTPPEVATCQPAFMPISGFSSAPSSFSQSMPVSLVSSPVSDKPTTMTHNSTPRNSFHSSGASSPHKPPSDIFASPKTPTVAPARECCPNASLATNAGGFCGSLLAAYGLETIQAPFRLSSTIHKKILRHEGWIEHRNSAAADNEFARGYALSFYTSSSMPSHATSQRRSSAPDVSRRVSAATTTTCVAGGKKNPGAARRKKINRGIVFVAYRRPRGPDGAVNSSTAELNALEKEAATLVDLILDFHQERRRWETLQEIQQRRRGSESAALSPL